MRLHSVSQIFAFGRAITSALSLAGPQPKVSVEELLRE